MITKKLKLLFLLTLAFISSCGDDNENTNLPPVIENQSFNASESLDDATVIGTVQASDPEQGTLTFSITENSDNLFEINDDGELSLTTGSTLDFETATSHTLTVSVSDGNASANASITITVIDVNENVAPTIADQSFQISEAVNDTTVIGSIVASDDNNDVLTFSISEDPGDLFEITEGGAISLREGKLLDFGAASSHEIIVQVTDSEETNLATITIEVNEFKPFVTTWNITSANETLTIFINEFDPEDNRYPFDYIVKWGDGATTRHSEVADHTYDAPGVYTVEIRGVFAGIRNNTNPNAERLLTIESWGDIEWETMEVAFASCSNLTYNATDTPDLSKVENMGSMFRNATVFNGAIGSWDVSNVTNMSRMFSGAETFNQPLDRWNVSNVTTMEAMFDVARSFNQDLNNWNTSSLTTMRLIFRGAEAFNGAIGNWDVSQVTDMLRVFQSARVFNQDISGWDVSNVTGMVDFFNIANKFNQDISSWDVSNVTNMANMFNAASDFNQDISGWKVGKVTNMQTLFSGANRFNADISQWDVSNVQFMFSMFNNAIDFNQDISEWKVSKVINMDDMFNNARSFNQDISTWDVSKVTNMANMFRDTPSFTQDLSGWETTNVTSCDFFAPNSGMTGFPNFPNCPL